MAGEGLSVVDFEEVKGRRSRAVGADEGLEEMFHVCWFQKRAESHLLIT